MRPQRGQSREFLQAGIELIGAESPEGTVEVLTVLCQALDAAGLESYRIGLGDASLYPALLDRLDVHDDPELRERILTELAAGPRRIRVGLFVDGAPAREGAAILDAAGTEIGTVTSGGFAPTLSRAIAIGFVPPAHAAPGTALQVVVRGRAQAAQVVPTPFVPHRYVRKAS